MLSFFATKKHDVYNRNSLTHIEGQMTPARRKIRAALLIFTFNVLFGIVFGLIFSAVERPAELIEREYATRLYARLNSTMPADDWAELLSSFGASAESIEADIAALDAGTFHSGDVVDFNWDRTGGMFFAFTVATSIGYGSFCPVTPTGRALTIIYAFVSIPLMLAAFTTMCNVLLRLLAEKLAGKKRDLPVKTFRILDRDRSGTLGKLEVVKALRLMGLGSYSGRRATMEKKRKFMDAWDKVNVRGTNQLQIAEFQKLLRSACMLHTSRTSSTVEATSPRWRYNARRLFRS